MHVAVHSSLSMDMAVTESALCTRIMLIQPMAQADFSRSLICPWVAGSQGVGNSGGSPVIPKM